MVGPIALVLHLKQIAFKIQSDGSPSGQVQRKLPDSGKERNINAVLELLRPDEFRQYPAHGSGAGQGAIGSSGRCRRRMEDAKADPVVTKARDDFSRHGTGNDALRRPRDLAMPCKIHGLLLMADVETNLKIFISRLNRKVGDFAREWLRQF